LLIADLRVPGYDHWTEYRGAGADSGAALWGTSDLNATDSNAAGFFKVGSYSVEGTPTSAVNRGFMYYPSTSDASWDLTAVGSTETIPTINFYCYQERNFGVNFELRLRTNAADYYQAELNDAYYMNTVADEWIHIRIPVGPNYSLTDEARFFRWTSAGNPDWTDIDDVCFVTPTTVVSGGESFFVDDVHFAGKIIREAKNSWSISGNVGPPAVTAKNEHQVMVTMQTSVDDTIKATDDTGRAGQLAYAELLTRDYIPTVGYVQTPGIVDVLPGQKFHIHADKQYSGTFRIDSDFRTKEIQHAFTNQGFVTTLFLTDDVVRSFAKGSPSEMASVLAQVLYTDPEAHNLKSTGTDRLVPRLSQDYQFDDD